MFNILRSIKNIFVHIRSSLKFVFIIIVAGVLIAGIVSLFYKITYEVTLNGEVIGYTRDKAALQERINAYTEAEEEKNVAFVDLDVLPEYSLCLLKKETVTNDDEIFNKVQNVGKNYYEYYAISLKGEEKYYVSTKEEAEEIINKLKEKNSANINSLAYAQVYGPELKEFAEKDKVVEDLYEKRIVRTYSSVIMGSTTQKVDLSQYGISLIKPVSAGYTITSRFGSRSGGSHTGLDIAAPTGTTIVAAEGGVVTLAGNHGNGYGEYIIILHGNGVSTLYGHCSAIYVTEGQTVSQGQAIGAVGSTGNSTGSHLHLEIRVDGTALNPQNYLY